MERRFKYMLKLWDGRLEFGEGASWEEAAKGLGIKLSEVKRSMPIKAIKTEEEIEASRVRVKKMLEKMEETDD